MYLGRERRGRLAGEMSWRVAALLALSGMVIVPAVSEGAQPRARAAVNVSVRPRAGSARTHFGVSFRAAATIGQGVRDVYRVTADDGAHRGCQSAVTVSAAPARPGGIVRVTLAPSGSRRWCAGTFRGKVWEVITPVCPPLRACPAIVPVPQQVGRFSFRVTLG
jgi:hypothetical protein